jgi:hypothetical protein
LDERGYSVDLSCAPGWNYQADGGPDYSDVGCRAFWDTQAPNVLRIPHTGGYFGHLCEGGHRLFRPDSLPFAKQLRLPGIASRLGLVTRTRLTLEGAKAEHMQLLARALCISGVRLLTLSYHSPSAEVGHTPYTKTTDDLSKLKAVLVEFLDFFTQELGGKSATAQEAHRLAKQFPPQSSSAPVARA